MLKTLLFSLLLILSPKHASLHLDKHVCFYPCKVEVQVIVRREGDDQTFLISEDGEVLTQRPIENYPVSIKYDQEPGSHVIQLDVFDSLDRNTFTARESIEVSAPQ